MIKEFLPYDKVRNDALKMAYHIYNEEGFVPDVIYASLRGGAYMANVISQDGEKRASPCALCGSGCAFLHKYQTAGQSHG